jgi:hypothetical protein
VPLSRFSFRSFVAFLIESVFSNRLSLEMLRIGAKLSEEDGEQERMKKRPRRWHLMCRNLESWTELEWEKLAEVTALVLRGGCSRAAFGELAWRIRSKREMAIAVVCRELIRFGRELQTDTFTTFALCMLRLCHKDIRPCLLRRAWRALRAGYCDAFARVAKYMRETLSGGCAVRLPEQIEYEDSCDVLGFRFRSEREYLAFARGTSLGDVGSVCWEHALLQRA